MRTGVSYLGHHNPRHLLTDLKELADLRCDDVLLAAQENDFVHLTGKLKFLPSLAADLGLRPIAIFWGVLNLFGGGRSSQFLLEHPQAHQVKRDGSWHPAGCYNNSLGVQYIQSLIDRVAHLGFRGYFIDEPTPIDCYCESCRSLFARWQGGDLASAHGPTLADFRHRCVLHYIQTIAGYVKKNYPQLETMCCLMPHDRGLWARAAQLPGLDNLGTDIYWVNQSNDVEEMTPLVRELAALCRQHGKLHHQWLQAWTVKAGHEDRIFDQGRILVREQPDGLYVWAFAGQIGTTEASENPELSWSRACDVLRLAKS